MMSLLHPLHRDVRPEKSPICKIGYNRLGAYPPASSLYLHAPAVSFAALEYNIDGRK
jgi:hypothetical protein